MFIVKQRKNFNFNSSVTHNIFNDNKIKINKLNIYYDN